MLIPLRQNYFFLADFTANANPTAASPTLATTYEKPITVEVKYA